MNKKIHFFTLLILFGLQTAITFSATSGGIGITPYYGPKDAKRAWFIYENVKPGAIINDQVTVTNTTKELLNLVIYPVDAETARDGGYAPKADDAKITGVGGWMTLGASKLSLKPGEQKVISLKIRIPEKVGIGDHAGTILVRRETSTETRKIQNGEDGDEKGETTLNIITRIGARVYITIAGQLIKKLSFDELTFGKDRAGKPFFYFALANEGNTRLTPKGTLEIYDSENKLLETTDIDLREIFPYTETTVPVEWKNLRDGKFVAKGIIPDPNGEGRLVATTAFEWIIPKIPTPVEINSTMQQLLIGAGILIFILFTIMILMILVMKRKRK